MSERREFTWDDRSPGTGIDWGNGPQGVIGMKRKPEGVGTKMATSQREYD